MRQRDQGAEDGQAGHEGLGAVDRVQHPKVGRVAAHDAVFLAVDAVRGGLALQDLAHHRLGFAVGDRHGGFVKFAVDLQVGAEVGPDHRAGSVGEATGEFDERIGTGFQRTCGLGHRAGFRKRQRAAKRPPLS